MYCYSYTLVGCHEHSDLDLDLALDLDISDVRIQRAFCITPMYEPFNTNGIIEMVTGVRSGMTCQPAVP